MEFAILAIMTVLCGVAYGVGRWQGSKVHGDRAKELKSGLNDVLVPQMTSVTVAIDSLNSRLQEKIDQQNEKVGALKTAVENCNTHAQQLGQKTAELRDVLTRNSAARGALGEYVLIRVLEMAEFEEGRDYELQKGAGGVRPDVKILLPRGNCILVDAKTPSIDKAVAEYDGVRTQSDDQRPDARNRDRKSAAKQLADTIYAEAVKLKQRDYPAKVNADSSTPWQSPDVTVLFLPWESVLSIALAGDPELLKKSAKQRVVLATPSTLLAMLAPMSMIMHGHRREQNERNIAADASVLYEKVQALVKKMVTLKTRFEESADALDGIFSTYSKQVRPVGSRLQQLGVRPGADDALSAELTGCDVNIRALSDKELKELPRDVSEPPDAPHVRQDSVET